MALLGDTKAISLTLLDGVIGDLNPKTTEVYNLGTSSLKWNNIYGTLKGNADTATSAAAFTSAQSVTLTGDTTGSASSTAGWTITTKTDRLTPVGDNRSVATQPSDYSNKLIFQGLKTNSVINSPSSDLYSYLIGLNGWTNTSGGNVHELAFNNSGIYWRNGNTTWNSWNKMASLKETGELWADNQNLTTGIATYITLDITTPSGSNNRIFGTIKVGNYSSSTIFSGPVSFYFFWNGTTFSSGYYYDPTDSITGLTLIKNEDGKFYLEIQHSVRYVNFFVYVNSSQQKQGDNRAIAYTCSTNPITNATITKEAQKIAHYAYGVCDTAQTTKAKVVTLSTTWVIPNGIIQIKFTYGIKVASATLNINSTGAKPILYNGVAITVDENIIKPGDVATFLYTGNNYYLIAVDNSFTAGSFGTSSNSTPGFGGTFTIPYITTDKHGRVTAISNTTITLPSSDNTDTKVNVVARGTTKAYLLADTTAPTSTAAAHSAVAESDVYLDTTAGRLAATSFKLAELATITYNTTTNAIDFNFI